MTTNRCRTKVGVYLSIPRIPKGVEGSFGECGSGAPTHVEGDWLALIECVTLRISEAHTLIVMSNGASTWLR